MPPAAPTAAAKAEDAAAAVDAAAVDAATAGSERRSSEGIDLTVSKLEEISDTLSQFLEKDRNTILVHYPSVYLSESAP